MRMRRFISFYAERYGRGRSAGWRASCLPFARGMPAKRIASGRWLADFFKGVRGNNVLNMHHHIFVRHRLENRLALPFE